MLRRSCPGAGGRSREMAPAPDAALDHAWSMQEGASCPLRSDAGRLARVCVVLIGDGH